MYFGISAQAGSRYAAVFENLESGQLETFTMTEKSDFGDDLSTFAQELRDDPRFVACTGNTSIYEPRNECHMFSHVNLEMNKDWNTADATFLNMMKEQGIHIIRNDAERHGNDLNGTIPYVEMAMKQIVHETSIPPKFWPETLDAVTLLMNHLPNARSKSKNGKTTRPIEILSAGIVSKRYCNHVLFYFCSPGTPAYCSAPCETGKANVRPAVRMGQIGTIPTWMCPFTGDTFTSKDYTIIALHSGENAWQMFGAKTPPVMEHFGYYYGNDRSVTAQQQGQQMHKSDGKNDADIQGGLQDGMLTRSVMSDDDGGIISSSEVMTAEWSPECLAAVDAVTEKYKAHTQTCDPSHQPATDTQVMPTAGLNHDNDVKQPKKTTTRLHKDYMESKKECMAKDEPQIVFPVHEEQQILMDPSTEGVDKPDVNI